MDPNKKEDRVRVKRMIDAWLDVVDAAEKLLEVNSKYNHKPDQKLALVSLQDALFEYRSRLIVLDKS